MNELDYLLQLRKDIDERIKSLRNKNNIYSDKKKIRELFKNQYEAKAKEITGKEAKLPWSGKEGKLLNIDLETHGTEVLVKYIELFFSDKDYNVANFTRYKNKAGYSYSVFHGLIPKLAISTIKPPVVCKYCGKADGHTWNCKISVERREQAKREKEEIEKMREENKNISFTEMFMTNLTKKRKSTKPLTFDNLADLYNERNNTNMAKTLPLEKVYDWATKEPDIVINEDTSLSLKELL